MAVMYVKKEFTFDAAHYLEKYHGKCERLHGHTYRLAITVKGEPDSEGMVMDFIELKEIVKEKVLSVLDHSCLNDIIPQPTTENVVLWIKERLKPAIKGKNCSLSEIQLWEGPGSSIILKLERVGE